MNEKFINVNCAQMAAVSMWILMTSQGRQCKLVYYQNAGAFEVVVFLDAGAEVKIPKGYCYTSKSLHHFDASETTPAFSTIAFTFEY